MKVAIMQPYFFPYIGYWQLIHAADKFVLFDDVQYMRHGWVNRNRVLKHGGGWQYILVPLRKHSLNDLIRDIAVHQEKDWQVRILRQLEHYNYGYKNRAPFYAETMDLLEDVFSGISQDSLAGVNAAIIRKVCSYLGITTPVLISSEQGFDYGGIQHAGEWALRIAQLLNAQEYINPIGGRELFSQEQFRLNNVKLSFLKSGEIRYAQGAGFEPSLSIVDVLMYNGQQGTRMLLDRYSIEPAW